VQKRTKNQISPINGIYVINIIQPLFTTSHSLTTPTAKLGIIMANKYSTYIGLKPTPYCSFPLPTPHGCLGQLPFLRGRSKRRIPNIMA